MKKLICGPMATLSHEAFRRVVEEFGFCDEYFTEMINAPSLLNMGPFEKYYIRNEPCPEKIVWQLTGNSAEPMAKAALVVAPLGGIGVDLNMGCSAPQIYKTGAGISWMMKPLEETRNLVRQVKTSLDSCEKESGKHMRLSVKCRLGREDFTEESFFSFTDMLVQEGVELITIHPRTMKEKYRLPPKYFFAELLARRYEKLIPVYVNGDVWDAKSLALVNEICPTCKGVMISRAAAQKPWIFKELSLSENSESKAFEVDAEKLALDFIHNVELYQPKEFHRTRLQRFFAYYCQNFSFAHYFATQMMNASTVEESILRVKDYFNKQPEERKLKVER